MSSRFVDYIIHILDNMEQFKNFGSRLRRKCLYHIFWYKYNIGDYKYFIIIAFSDM